jgi:preprotein translocase subunit SecD
LRRSLRLFILIAAIVGLSVASLLVRDIHLALGGLHFDRAGKGPLGLKLGLDLLGGSHLIYEADIPDPTPEQMDGVLSTIERRINAFGVAEPIVQRMGDKRLVVQLPGVRNIEEAKRLIGQTARLEFKERQCLVDPRVEDCDKEGNHIDKDTGLTGDDLARAWPGTHQTKGTPIVNIQFKARGTEIFADLTRRMAGKPEYRIAIFLDNEELLAPVVERPILDGTAYIEGGDFTMERVRTIAIQLESGRLPVPLKLVKESTVDAVLGADSLRRSLMAGLVGLALVFLFTIIYYRVPGIVAGVALLIYASIALAIFKLLPVTLTLAGIAGFILSIGMAVDANILIFERMKEELRGGRTLASAMEVGFNRAWPSIRDSNVSTFITCAILYWFGSRLGASLVMGFALTLFIGVAVSMFTAITVSRNLLQLVALTPVARRLNLFTPEPLRRPAEVGGRS